MVITNRKLRELRQKFKEGKPLNDAARRYYANAERYRKKCELSIPDYTLTLNTGGFVTLGMLMISSLESLVHAKKLNQ